MNTKKKRITAFDIVVYSIAIVLTALVLYPLILVLSSSISDPSLVAKGEVVFLPKGINLEGYKALLEDRDIVTGYANTIFYTVVGTIINLFVTVPAGYVLSKGRQVVGNKIFMTIFMITMYFHGGMIPTFLLVQNLGLYNTRWVLLIMGAFSVYNCIICRSFFAGMPKELEEAAYLDGCSVIRTFLTIILPLSRTLLGVMVLYFAVAHWNSYFHAMVYTYDEKIQPLQLFLRKILVLQQNSAEMMVNSGADEYAAEQEAVAALIKYAVIVVYSLTVMIIYPFLQKYFDKGVLIGSVKG